MANQRYSSAEIEEYNRRSFESLVEDETVPADIRRAAATCILTDHSGQFYCSGCGRPWTVGYGDDVMRCRECNSELRLTPLATKNLKLLNRCRKLIGCAPFPDSVGVAGLGPDVGGDLIAVQQGHLLNLRLIPEIRMGDGEYRVGDWAIQANSEAGRKIGRWIARNLV